MGSNTLVKVTKGDRTGRVTQASLPLWERNGWTRADDGSSEQSAPAAPAEPVPTQEG